MKLIKLSRGFGSGVILRTGRATFTLIEMLIVVAVISILASMTLPALRGAMGTSRKLSCLNNLKQNGMMFVTYCDDNNGSWPFRNYIITDLAPMLAGKLNQPTHYTFLSGVDQYSLSGVFLCPDAAPVEDVLYYRSSYGVTKGIQNSFGRRGGAWFFDYTVSPSAVIRRNYRQIPPSSVLMLELPLGKQGNALDSGKGATVGYHNAALRTNEYFNNTTEEQRLQAAAYENHNMSANFLFADGHVSTHAAGTKFSFYGPGSAANLDSWWLVK